MARTKAENSDYVAQKLSHLSKGDSIVPPLEREPDALDEVIHGVIDALPAAQRLYPDLFAWIIADAVREQLQLEAIQTNPQE